MTTRWKAVEQYVTVVLFGFSVFYSICNFGKFINFGLGTVSSERVISIYTLSALGVLSNLIGSLSRAIQQYSPPSEWIMRNS